MIISLVKKQGDRYWKRTHKFGIELPKTWDDCLRLDKQNGNTTWQDAVAKELKVVKIVFDVLEDGTKVPKRYTNIKCHLVFDVKMEDFRQKARLVAGGNTTKTPGCTTYASVVSCETVRLALMLASLN